MTEQAEREVLDERKIGGSSSVVAASASESASSIPAATISLNESQLAAVTHNTEDALLVMAGPGSGKTRVIVERVKYLISNLGIKPSQILCLTFSEKAAVEMRTRIERQANTTEVETATYHSFCLGILEEAVLETGVSFRSGLISRANQLVWGLKNIDNFGFEHIEIGNNAIHVIESLIDGISAFRDEVVSPEQLKDYIDKKRQEYQAELLQLQEKEEEASQAEEEAEQKGQANESGSSAKGNKKKKTMMKQKSRVRKVTGAQEELQEKIAFLDKLSDLQKVYAQYEKYKRKESLIDYDDMLQIVIETFRRKPEVLRRYQQKYAYVLVDEFQDNNYAQLELVKLLCPHGNITAVGDDDQSIYRFRGAYLTIFDDLQRYYKDNGNTIDVVKLERNYRSTKNIVSLAKKLLDPVPDRVQKNLYSENEDGDRPIVARCSTDSAEIDYLVNKIRNDLVGTEFTRRDGTTDEIRYSDFAILSRRRLEGVKFAKALKAHGLPCTLVGESRIFSMPIIRDLLAYLRVAEDPLDNGIELTRILLAHGVPEQDVKIINHAAKAKVREMVRRLEKDIEREKKIEGPKKEEVKGEREGKTDVGHHFSRSDDTDNNRNYGTDFVYDVIEEVALPSSSSTSSSSTPEGSSTSIADQLRARSLVTDVYNQIRNIVAERGRKTLGQFVYDVLMIHTDIYKRTLNDGESDEESTRNRLALHGFLEIVGEFESISKKDATLKELLAHIQLMSDFDIELEQGSEQEAAEQQGGGRGAKRHEDSITVTTIHQSKGREFPIVFVVDVADRRLPVKFQEKEFYCPSDLAHGLRDREKDEKQIFLEEERRLLYVAMTRAQHSLFLTYAELYGDNIRKTKPSQFLVELDVVENNNPLVRFETYNVEARVQALAVSESRIEQVKQECQLLATKYVSQMQLKSAYEKIIQLAMLERVRSGQSLDGFAVEEMLTVNIAIERARVEEVLRDEHVPLVDGDTIHFSASALKTYQDCPLKYKFQYVLEVPSPPKTYFDLGTAVHSTVEVLTRRQIEDPQYVPTKEEAIKVLDRYWVSNSYESTTKERQDRESAEKMLEFFCRWCAERKDAGYTPIEAEKKFEIEIAGKRVIGYIDRIDRALTCDEHEVFDYKTGNSTLNGSQIRSDIQMNMYSLAIEKLYGKLPKSANLLYLKKENRVTYDVDTESVAESKEKIISLIDGVLKERFDPHPDYNTCRFCDYQSICEAKEIEGENP